MNARRLSLIPALTMALWGRAEDAPKIEQVERLVRDFAFASNTNLNTNTVFLIRKLDVGGLWESMRLQVFDVAYTLKNVEWFNGFVGLYSGGKISVLAPNLGGYGFMSGLIHNGDFYYTYSWGSGIHRSHVVKSHLTRGQLEAWDSGGFQDKDLFVSVGSDGNVHVVSGVFNGFNHWEAGKDIGSVEMTNSSALQIIDSKGEVIRPTFPSPREKSQPGPPPNGGPGTPQANSGALDGAPSVSVRYRAEACLSRRKGVTLLHARGS